MKKIIVTLLLIVGLIPTPTHSFGHNDICEQIVQTEQKICSKCKEQKKSFYAWNIALKIGLWSGIIFFIIGFVIGVIHKDEYGFSRLFYASIFSLGFGFCGLIIGLTIAAIIASMISALPLVVAIILSAITIVSIIVAIISILRNLHFEEDPFVIID